MNKKKFHLETVITINTDASYNPSDNSGGYGIWIKSDFFTIKNHGKFKSKIVDANEAEIKAIVNALKILRSKLISNSFPVRFNVLIFNCDNACARNIINRKKYSERFKHEGEMLLNLISGFDVSYAKHINGHKKAINARQYVNNWCDKMSKKYRSQLFISEK